MCSLFYPFGFLGVDDLAFLQSCNEFSAGEGKKRKSDVVKVPVQRKPHRVPKVGSESPSSSSSDDVGSPIGREKTYSRTPQ